MKRVDELFDVKYGVNLELNSLTLLNPGDPNGVNFVSRTAKNNGVAAFVERIADCDPIPAGTLSVACGGSVLETYLQPKPYYSGRDLFFLTPLIEMTDIQKIYYAVCIKLNKYRYNYGRQANKTLKSILIPDINEIPSQVTTKPVMDYSGINRKLSEEMVPYIPKEWKPFRYDDIFIIERGSSFYIQDMKAGKFPYVSASSINNGITGYVDVHNREGNQIVVNYDGSVAEAFYHDTPFLASEKVVSIELKNHELNKYIAFFLITLIRKEKYRFNYGLKWSVNKRMRDSIIRLPVKPDNNPDYEYMERFIKTRLFSASI